MFQVPDQLELQFAQQPSCGAVSLHSLFQSWCYALQSGLLNAAPFDPLNLRSEDQKEREIKNGRLAMVAFLGFSSQAAVQGKGPLASLSYHLEDPFKRNSKQTSRDGRRSECASSISSAQLVGRFTYPA